MLAVAILAAGKGTRMKSAYPKVLLELAGVSLVQRVINSFQEVCPERTLVVVGHEAEQIQRHLSHIPELEFILQEPQKGTGHAIQHLLPILDGFKGDLLVLNGDVPLLSKETVKALISTHRTNNSDVTLLTSRPKDPSGYGRVFTGSDGRITSIIEHKDCNEKQLHNPITNAGIYCFKWSRLAKVLPRLSSNNSQGELYLTDTISLLSCAMQLEIANTEEVTGVNNHIQLAECESLIQKHLRKKYMELGVSFIDPLSCTVSEDCDFGKDVIIEPQTHLRGKCKIGSDSHIGPGCLIENSQIGDNVQIIHSVIRESKVGNGTLVGPFAHLRPQVKIGNNCKIGNFVEIKKSFIGEASKINHLSYIGDAELGKKINIGAGTIVANYDGIKKHKTFIGDFSKTGANSVLVAPIILGLNVTVGAGSTITKDVPSNSLALGRSKQLTKNNWIGPSKH